MKNLARTSTAALAFAAIFLARPIPASAAALHVHVAPRSVPAAGFASAAPPATALAGPAPGLSAGFLPSPIGRSDGLVLDAAPSAPDPSLAGGAGIDRFDVPGRGLSMARTLAADPADDGAVERDLRALVDASPSYYGVSSAELGTVHVRRVTGAGRQADTIYAVFRQQRGGLAVQGSSLSFTIKIVKGRARVVSTSARLYAELAVDVAPRFSETELSAKAAERVAAAGLKLAPLDRRIIFAEGAWRAAALYGANGAAPVTVAVDLADGRAIAWDPRSYAAPAISGQVQGRIVEKGPIRPDSVPKAVPMPHLNLRLANGQTVVTDQEGRFTLDSPLPAEGVKFSAALSGRYAAVANYKGVNMNIEGTLLPGREVLVTFNPEGASVNAYRFVNLVHDWLKARGVTAKGLDVPIPVDANIDERCNAFYTPGNPSLNFFRSNADCANTAYDTVVMHEYGHFVDDMTGGSSDQGLGEGWGDIFSMYLLDYPVIGEGFLKKPLDGIDYIRHGENNYQYKPWDKIHEQGQAWGGFAWKLRKSLIAQLGQAAGAAMAEALVLPVIYAKARDIPKAMAQVMLNDMDKDGHMPHEALIRATAQAHGITLKPAPGRLADWARRAAAWLFSPSEAVAS